ncbi:MAG: hypothetical protein V9F03_10595 [Microthrixaceae bacterium]
MRARKFVSYSLEVGDELLADGRIRQRFEDVAEFLAAADIHTVWDESHRAGTQDTYQGPG